MTDVVSDTNTGEAIVFWVCAILAVLGALGMVVSRKAVHSALWIALTMINLAILYVANSAPFLGMVQVIVYTGAVMMLFLFVLMVVGAALLPGPFLIIGVPLFAIGLLLSMRSLG